MARHLLTDEPAFAAAIDEIEPMFLAEVGFSLRQALAGTQRAAANDVASNGNNSPGSRRAAARLAARASLNAASDTELRGDARVQPVLMGLQLALTAMWRSHGVEPDAVIGHSMGEVAAAVVAGALTLREGLHVIAARSQLMSRLAGQGAVALLELNADETTDLIATHPDITLAVYSSPQQTVIAGPPAQIDELMATVQRRDRFAHRVNMEVASHNPIMDPILPELRTALAGLEPKTPTIPMISTIYQDPTTPPAFDADYWAAGVRNPVHFQQAITHAAADHHTFIEISPHPVMTNAITQTLADTHHHSIGTLRRDTNDTHSFHTNLNATYTTHPPSTPHRPGRYVDLPNTPWHHSRHWIDATPTLRATKQANNTAVHGDSQNDWYYKLAWPARPMPDAGTVASGSWVVLADAGLGAEIDRAVGGGSAVTVLPPSIIDDADPTALLAALRGADNVLFAPDISSTQLDVATSYQLFNAGRKLAATLASTESPTRLFLLTRNAQPLAQGDRANAAHAVLWGLGRTLALEQPEIWGGLIDLDDTVPAELAAEWVLGESRCDDGEDQVVYRAGVRHVPRLERSSASAPVDRLDPDTCQLVIGATGNIGPHLIRQLAQMGAATIVAVSRNPGSRLDELAQTLAASGTKVVTIAADATDPRVMKALFDRFGTDLPPLEGIYLAAFGGGPVTLRDMTDDDVDAMFRPKLDTLALLHQLSLKSPVRQFVLFSSISGLLGSRWLAHYTATSAFLDTFAYARRNIGLAATVVNWGLWKSLSDGQADEEQRLSIESGLLPMVDDVAIAALPSTMGPDASIRSVVVAADWDLLAAAYRTRGKLRIIDDLLSDEDQDTAAAAGEFRESLQACRSDRRRDLLVAHIATTAAAVMGLSQSQSLDPSTGFFQLGMDSLMSVLLQRALAQSLGETLPSSLVFDYPTVDAVADYLATIMPELARMTDTPEAERFDQYESLTEDELLQQLSERLS
jgi:phthiocerol/phenolphthiocerol synthesis type-I polyketide synthase B